MSECYFCSDYNIRITDSAINNTSDRSVEIRSRTASFFFPSRRYVKGNPNIRELVVAADNTNRESIMIGPAIESGKLSI